MQYLQWYELTGRNAAQPCACSAKVLEHSLVPAATWCMAQHSSELISAFGSLAQRLSMQQTQLGHGQPEVLLLPRLAWAEHTRVCLQPQGSSQAPNVVAEAGKHLSVFPWVQGSTLVYPPAKEITKCSSSSAHRCPPDGSYCCRDELCVCSLFQIAPKLGTAWSSIRAAGCW